jgi:hypothetical protein
VRTDKRDMCLKLSRASTIFSARSFAMAVNSGEKFSGTLKS